MFLEVLSEENNIFPSRYDQLVLVKSTSVWYNDVNQTLMRHRGNISLVKFTKDMINNCGFSEHLPNLKVLLIVKDPIGNMLTPCH